MGNASHPGAAPRAAAHAFARDAAHYRLRLPMQISSRHSDLTNKRPPIPPRGAGNRDPTDICYTQLSRLLSRKSSRQPQALCSYSPQHILWARLGKRQQNCNTRFGQSVPNRLQTLRLATPKGRFSPASAPFRRIDWMVEPRSDDLPNAAPSTHPRLGRNAADRRVRRRDHMATPNRSPNSRARSNSVPRLVS
jgi:hypothetical protein